MRRMLTLALCAATSLLWIVGHAQSPSASAVADPPAAATAQDPAPNPPPESKHASQRVTGKLVDCDGKAVDKAEIRFEGPKKDKVWSDAHGAFTFTGPPGDYTVSVKAGERHQDFKVKIEENQLKPATLVIEPAPLP